MECKWLPPLVPCLDWNRFADYEDEIYELFCQDFIDSQPSFEGRPVHIRKEPRVDGWVQAFFHVTSSEYTQGKPRDPDIRRCERIRWIRAFIENYNCDPSLCPHCDGVKVWEEPYKTYKRVHLLLEEENYMVIIERRETYALLITAYYFDYPHTLEKQLKKYRAYIKQSAPL